MAHSFLTCSFEWTRRSQYHVREAWNQILDRIGAYSPWEVIIELTIIWLGVFFVVRFLRGTRGAGIIKGLALLLILGTLAVRLLSGGEGQSFQRLTYLYNRSLGFVAIALIVIFQPELRRALIRLGETVFIRRANADLTPVINAIVEACDFLARNKIGAIIAVERNVGLGGLVEGGTSLNADISSRLLQSIFWPNSALHDLGVIVRGARIVAAGVQFPMAEHGELDSDFGSRHRAAVGITHESDCICVVVSEERGVISIAERGRLRSNVSVAELREVLQQRLIDESFPFEVGTASMSETEDGTDDHSGFDATDQKFDKKQSSASSTTTATATSTTRGGSMSKNSASTGESGNKSRSVERLAHSRSDPAGTSNAENVA